MRAMDRFPGWLRDTRGMSTVEYAILLVLIVAGSVGLWRSVGQNILDALRSSDTQIENNVQMLGSEGGGG